MNDELSLRVVGAGLGRTGPHSLKLGLAQVLDVPVPDEPFPHLNTTKEFRAMTGLDG